MIQLTAHFYSPVACSDLDSYSARSTVRRYPRAGGTRARGRSRACVYRNRSRAGERNTQCIATRRSAVVARVAYCSRLAGLACCTGGSASNLCSRRWENRTLSVRSFCFSPEPTKLCYKNRSVAFERRCGAAQSHSCEGNTSGQKARVVHHVILTPRKSSTGHAVASN